MDGKKLEYKGEKALEELEKLTMNAGEVQESILREILGRNGETEYLNKYMKGSMDTKEYRRRVPVIAYDDVRPYVRRIADGEPHSILSGDPITELLISSGTSGAEPKLMPSIAEDLDRRTYLYNLIMPIMNQYITGLNEGKAMNLLFVKAETLTRSGLPTRPVLTSYYKSEHFLCRPRHDPFNDLTSPDPTILCPDTHQSMYSQLLAGLVHRHSVLRIGAVFASALLRALRFLERNWPKLCDDIRRGLPGRDVTDPACRSALERVMRASGDAGLADEVGAICARASWRGVLCLLWPRAKYVEAVLTGSMAQYVPALEFYSDGRLPLVCTMYASSECYFGLNLTPLCDPADVSYTLLPNMGYFEFILLGDGLDEEAEDFELVGLADIEVGRHYELVVTTFAGLYRYRIGDVLLVTGFHNRAPKFRFICRRGVLLSIDCDKTNEEELHRSVSAAKKLLESRDALLVEYTSCADASTIPGHYVLYWEIARTSPTSADAARAEEEEEVMRECCAAVEESLGYVYRRCRAREGSVGPLEIRVVEAGAFEALMDLCVGRGGSINQYKTPRCIRSAAEVGLLEGKVMACFFSPRLPSWSP
ncbi:putative indole-3-acetic acid-amido synthetase GH3.11 [Acorus gramineus]|uniref:Indole-3-acetic acid-amido synthetase GH3.11 n=1 Tax=Acorus gramineus TaxID=55184 RepID=A0AAV9BV89_ACOGR|nr:putative indole-3-acetic acid-amido synthetase GH3.11 [Acorus gramineus]